jgi:sterol desaturase/sphingolipid hydroxylase (fatty acid hydroxylase superfamily)
VRCGTFGVCFPFFKSRHRKDPIQYQTTLPVVLRNQIFILLPSMVAAAYYGCAFQENVSVPLVLVPLYAIILGIIHDIVFYFGHKLLHTRFGYHYLGHKLHHESKGGTAATSMFMSPIDFILEIIAPYGTFLLIVQTDTRFNILLASVGSVAAMYEVRLHIPIH